MAPLQSVALFVWAFVLATSTAFMVPFADTQCASLFHTSVEGSPSGIGEIVKIIVDVDEATNEKAVLYTMSWDQWETVEPPTVTDPQFIKYFTVNDSTDGTWEVSLNAVLTGVPDYGLSNPVKKIETQVTFTGFTSPTSCTVTLTHDITDANTQKPTSDKANYNMDISEDFPPKYAISTFTTSVQDFDGTSPNNQFAVTTKANCPLEATASRNTSGENAVAVTYQLKESLDFETVDGPITCKVTFQDLGTPSLKTTAIITVNVEDVPDEPPEFTEEFYFAEVTTIDASADPLPIRPSSITAEDGDLAINATITYTMTDVNTADGTRYFAINDKTGQVTQILNLDSDFLKHEHVLFSVEAFDSSQRATTLLGITLPQEPTTTASTTPATTCEPCVTCPTYTTEEVTECPTEGTCPPCPSDTTTEFTCPSVTCPTTPSTTTCPEVTCPTTPGTTTCPVVTCPTTPGTTTCPVVTCPTTPDTTTCPEVTCPTTPSTTTCPVVTCPTTPGECTCDPCSTGATTEFTCPTTSSEDSCPPCPTNTTTECTCPVVTCPTTPGPTTQSPAQVTLTFKQASYTGDTYPTAYLVYQVEVVATGYEVIYSWSDDSEGKQYFDIAAATGEITVKKGTSPPEHLYQMRAVAKLKIDTTTKPAMTKVNIRVLPITSDEVMILSSIVRYEAREGEGEEDVGIFSLSIPAGKMCIVGSRPLAMHDSFHLEIQDDTNYRLRRTDALDYEAVREVTLLIKAYDTEVLCPQADDNINLNLLKSEALAIITVKDSNDEVPVFDAKELVVAYPTNEGLRRAVGPVLSAQAKDNDTEEVTYSVTGHDAAKFTVDEETGDVYMVKSLECSPECDINVTASDGQHNAQMTVKVLPLDMKHVYTLFMNNKTVSEVDDDLTQLSQEVGVQISKLYVSPTVLPTAAMQGSRQKQETQLGLEVHVYSLKDGALMSLEGLNSALGESSSHPQAEEFLDEEVFEAPKDDPIELTVAVAVLGSLLGCVLIAGLGFFVYRKKKGTTPKAPRSPSPINTLGNAYSNPSYEKEGPGTERSLGHKTNGFTSVEVHRTLDRDSPPMNRSALATPKDAIQLRSMDQQQQQAGLMRTIPSSPEYYGSSTPAPPPSYTRTTASPTEPQPSSSSSYPIYAEIKKPKDPKPKPETSASTSSAFRPEKADPDFFTYKKSPEPNTDYEEIGGGSKFSGLKASPPPRRSNRQEVEEEDDEDDDDERKSVAFKVMVDTKEIEAENMGPAQRKAEAEMRMEANRKKLQEEGKEEEEEEEEEVEGESAKL